MQCLPSQSTLQMMIESFYITFKTHLPLEKYIVPMQESHTIFLAIKMNSNTEWNIRLNKVRQSAAHQKEHWVLVFFLITLFVMPHNWTSCEPRGQNENHYRKAPLHTHKCTPLSCILHFPLCLTGAVAEQGTDIPAMTRNRIYNWYSLPSGSCSLSFCFVFILFYLAHIMNFTAGNICFSDNRSSLKKVTIKLC